jgi:hypothetical protein
MLGMGKAIREGNCAKEDEGSDHGFTLVVWRFASSFVLTHIILGLHTLFTFMLLHHYRYIYTPTVS